jgi:alcohol dehydrogenase class IV
MKFAFNMPTKIISGRDVIICNYKIFSSLGKKAIIVTGRHSAEANGSLADVLSALKLAGVGYDIFNNIMSNPTIDIVYDGAKFAKEHGDDFVVAIGGGSPMDAAKAIALLAAQDISRESLFSGKYTDEILPMVFIPTTAGTGSEVTQYSILTNDELETKTTLSSPIMFPDYAFLDGKYMCSLGKNTTINTAIDALSHAIEGFLNKKANEMTAIYSEKAIRIISSLFKKIEEDYLSLEDRDNLLFASTLAGIVISHTGTTAVHSMGYSLTYFKDIDHGRANGLLLGRYLEFLYDYIPDKVNEVLSFMNMNSVSEFKDKLDSLFGEKEKITKEEIVIFVGKALAAKNLQNSLIVPENDDLIKILEDVFLGA